MSDPIHLPDTQQSVTAGEVSSLLKHLQRCGVMFLPKSDVVAPSAREPAVLAPPTQVARTASAGPRPAAASTVASPPSAMADRQRQSMARAVAPAAAPPPAISVASSYAGPSLPLADRIRRLEDLAGQVAGCPRCEVLACSRKKTVFGEGDPAARVCFFGEAPGAEEDATGRPFVGRSGALLTKMIEACTFSREQIYLLNTVKCRPPGNRNPDAIEIDNCRPFFEQQLDTIRPQYIVCLGLVAAQTLLGSKLSIGRLRGRFHRYHDSKVLATYHPSYLLRNPSAKKEAWADLQMLMRDMGIETRR